MIGRNSCQLVLVTVLVREMGNYSTVGESGSGVYEKQALAQPAE